MNQSKEFQDRWLRTIKEQHLRCIRRPPELPKNLDPDSIAMYIKLWKRDYRIWTTIPVWILFFPILITLCAFQQLMYCVQAFGKAQYFAPLYPSKPSIFLYTHIFLRVLYTPIFLLHDMIGLGYRNAVWRSQDRNFPPQELQKDIFISVCLLGIVNGLVWLFRKVILLGTSIPTVRGFIFGPNHIETRDPSILTIFSTFYVMDIWMGPRTLRSSLFCTIGLVGGLIATSMIEGASELTMGAYMFTSAILGLILIPTIAFFLALVLLILEFVAELFLWNKNTPLMDRLQSKFKDISFFTFFILFIFIYVWAALGS